MAVTIHDTPQDFTPSDNPVTWTFSSDQTAQPNFAYLVEVYINAVLEAVELRFPESGIYGRFDASSYALEACGVPPTGEDLMTDASNYADINIRVIEYYGDPPAEQANATSAAVTVFKARLDDDDFVDWDASQYDATSGSTWLSNYPSEYNRRIKQTQEQQFIMAITNSVAISFSVILYDENDAVIAQDLGVALAPSPKIAIFNVSPTIIANGTSISTSDFDDCAYYTIQTTVFDLVRIDIDRDIEYEHYRRIHFLSEIGSIESYTFALISRPQAKIKSHGFRKDWGEWEGSSFNYTKTEGRDVDFAKYSERMIVIESDWLFEEVQHWLIRNLYESPVVFEERPKGPTAKETHLRRRKIMNTAWADKYNKNDTLFKEQITLGLPHKTSMIV